MNPLAEQRPRENLRINLIVQTLTVVFMSNFLPHASTDAVSQCLSLENILLSTFISPD